MRRENSPPHINVVPMTRPSGESHHSAKISVKTAKKLKETLANGTSIGRVAKKYKVSYQTVYRIATGETWKEIEPAGPVNVIKGKRGPKRRLSIKLQYLLWKKRRAGVSAAILAEKTGLSESSVRRLIYEFELILCHRISQLQLTSGSYEPANRKYGVVYGHAKKMDLRATQTPLSEKLRRVLNNDIPRLEKILDKKT